MSDVRVLIVDDQEPFRRAMTAVVEATAGFAVAGTAASGEESLDAAAELAPDVVLMDVNLPGISGIEASKILTSAPDGPVVILLSTYEEDQFDSASSVPRRTSPRRCSAPTDWQRSGPPPSGPQAEPSLPRSRRAEVGA